MAITIQHLRADQGASYSLTISILDEGNFPTDLTDAIAFASIRKEYTSTDAVAFFEATLSPATGGQLQISLTPEQTAGMEARRYVYDVLLQNRDNETIRVLEGTFTLDPSVTHQIWSGTTTTTTTTTTQSPLQDFRDSGFF